MSFKLLYIQIFLLPFYFFPHFIWITICAFWYCWWCSKDLRGFNHFSFSFFFLFLWLDTFSWPIFKFSKLIFLLALSTFFSYWVPLVNFIFQFFYFSIPELYLVLLSHCLITHGLFLGECLLTIIFVHYMKHPFLYLHMSGCFCLFLNWKF